MKTILTLLFAILLNGLNAQCTSDVPNYVIDLSNNADSTWNLFEVDALDRQGQCCGVGTNENCISFDVILNENTAGLFFDYDGAPAFGSLGWQIDCGPVHDLRDTICYAGTAPFTLTFCKPGSDNGNYTLRSVAKPTFPDDQILNANCQQPVKVLGVKADSPTWVSISPGGEGDFNHLLDCIDCLEPVFSPEAGIPSEIEYRVCGYPILDNCVGNFEFCDTVKFTILDSLLLNINNPNPMFCSGGQTTATASATGGDGNYNFIWYNSSLQEIGTSATQIFTEEGTYTVEVRDGNYLAGYCDDFQQSISVSESLPPNVSAGDDQVLCAESPNASISGSIEYASGGIWTGGNGTYVNSNTDLTMTYIPTASEISSGLVTITLTSTGANGSCSNDSDDLQLFYLDTIKTDLVDLTLSCSNSTVDVTPNITGGMSSYTFQWTNGVTTSNTTLNEGTHCLTITDQNGCISTKCITITTPNPLQLTLSSTPITSDGGSDGTVTASVTGGSSPYTYLWSNGGNNQTETGLSYGIYTLTVTDANGCEISGSVVVNEPRCNGFYVSTSSTNVSCFNNDNGSATVIINGGTSDFSILWNDLNAQTSNTANNLGSGVYEVVVTDANDCIATNTATVSEPDALLSNITHNNATTIGGIDGNAFANISGGTGTYTYSWSNGDTTPNADNLSEGWYYLTLNDENSCQIQDSVYISEPPCNLFNAQVGAKSTTCNGDSDGEAFLTISNGEAPYVIAWNSGESNVYSISGLAANTYYVEVTDARNCYTYQSFGISEPSALSAGLYTTQSSCFEANDGTIDLTATGGTYPSYYFEWSNGVHTEDLINLSIGTYSVTVTDENGCEAESSTTVTEPNALEVSHTSVTNPSCFGYTNGEIDITVTGGTTTYSFDWSNGAITEDLTNIDFGTYYLTLMDANYCTSETAIEIDVTEPEMVTATIDIACPNPGADETQVTITPTGGTSDYYISSNGGSNFGNITEYNLNLNVSDSYDIIVKDANDCLSDIYSITIDPKVEITEVDFNKCYFGNQSDEEIEVSISGGSPDYLVSTDNGQSFASSGIYNLDVNIGSNYTIIAKDSKGCISEGFEITLPEVISLVLNTTSNFNGEDVSCFGSNDGEITATVTGGTTDYNYVWNNGENTDVINNIGAGTYSLLLTDSEGCEISKSITLVNPDELTSSTSITSDYNGEDVSCFESEDGSAEIIVNGGVQPYSYTWSNGLSSAQIDNLSSGTYTITYEDINGCSNTNTVTLSEPPVLEMSYASTDVTCNDYTDGTIDITPNGGVLPYNFLWSNNEITEDVSNLSAGSYNVTLTDANNCILVQSDIIIEPTSTDVEVIVTDPLCFKSQDGEIDLVITGGTQPFSFNWSSGEDTEDINGVSAGAYNVTITDGNDCYTYKSIIVDEPDKLILHYSLNNPNCNGENNASINVTISGGTLPYFTEWSNGEQTEDLSSVSKGEYTIYIEDNHSCSLSKSIEITEPEILYSTIISSTQENGHNINLHDGNDGSIDATVFGGTAPYFYQWSNNSNEEDIDGLSAGTYTLLVTDSQGCTFEISTKLSEPLMLEMPTAFSPNGDGYNEVYFIKGIEAYPDNKLIVINRWGNILYEKNGYNNTWNGTLSNGEKVPDGVYFVILEINGKEITQNDFVELKRK